MRLRKKWWARPEMEASPLCIVNPKDYKGKWREEFKNDNEIYLELGCGRGDFVTNIANKHPEKNYVAIDLKDEVIAIALRKITESEVQNVRIAPLQIAFINEVFDKDEIARIYINFCNPWPKDRHKKRRLTHTKFLTKYKEFLKPNSQIWFKTDDDGLFVESLDYFKECGFQIKFMTYDLHKSGFDKNIVTEYESKFLKLGINIKFLIAELK
ncbi:tRNA (guanine-N7-)-methyltransferase [Clostridium acetobutylicum]|uniref:tRNA (guanine-N(7)-)-methyltransferase n=1 Tax=Clostridium acetobutylicum (strain ATCC 824 / DSM 792 / JCM 1419 / IAM 19013 / LMG 5710 / NBRC 13948 / NRRL B-527 / VKM B-1787 / 2291 / W) TaxID=272562 RepID=TRMB_CLOAB|nr:MULTISPECIES: tRNA (guanosine(46)-N7)-methyltransferase TrmB [Clostridium]Q97FU9.1 RecName: Full=tRNA (guanine-N(7)-)-methyltransferase; AltName: Full=tRNA (guanine(46)-N(7))-methyltransferase; AltName: Full=tRNA(m7G46)-methyltransferase [Clostridium acetobutylicum ATCC 824]AAK80574.1 Predicted S-adenosylmethionine-dependent methyltransferase, YtmQ B.subtilis ortholog [Clostridium acetobutylicum ATCC 824]ADZ21673.1 tRNA (guanine-N(7))-methyltransferase [Clostridium acetobutylicum EA 2018]AEI